jgi:hypothetical protein
MLAAVVGSTDSGLADCAVGTVAEGGVSGAWTPARVSSGHTGSRRGSPVMVAPACLGVRNPLDGRGFGRAVADENRGLTLCDGKPVERLDFCRGVPLFMR